MAEYPDIETVARYEAEVDLLRQRIDLAERVISVLREENEGLEAALRARDEELRQLRTLFDGVGQ